MTRDQGHGYLHEQQAFDAGAMELFPKYVGRSGPPPVGDGILSTTGLNLGYFDGNTQGSFDATANSVTQMFDFRQNNNNQDNTLVLDPNTGEPVQNQP